MADVEISDEQAKFITEASPSSVLLARPGSGKTRVGVLRFLDRARPASSSGIAYLSFTNVAIDEAQRRAAQLNRRDVLLPPNSVETLDGFIRTKVFDVFAATYFGRNIPDLRIVEELGRYYSEVDKVPGTAVFGVDKYAVTARRLKPFVRGGRLGFKFEESEHSIVDVDTKLSRTVLEAKRNMLFGGFARYDDIRMWSWRMLLTEGLRAAEILARRFPEILVDEAQDTTSIHREILKLLEDAGSKICYIGDSRQAIFEFGDAPDDFLEELGKSREPWELTMNFRSSDKIVGVVRAHFKDPKMEWSRTCCHDARGCFVFVGEPADAVTRFQEVLGDAGIDVANAAVLVRARALRREVLGEARIYELAPTVRRILVAWRRERNGDYESAAQEAMGFLLTVLDLDAEARRDRQRWKSLGWTFLRSAFPDFCDLTFSEWIDALRDAVEHFAVANGLAVRPKLGVVLSKRNAPATGKIADVVAGPPVVVRTDTVHGAKGKSIPAVLLVGTVKHHRNWLDLDDKEMTRIGYVAFSRAEDLLVLACPTDALAAEWETKGFTRL